MAEQEESFISIVKAVGKELPTLKELGESSQAITENLPAIQGASANAQQVASDKEVVVEIRNEITGLKTTASLLDSSQAITVTYTKETGTLHFGIPRGLKGNTGESYNPDKVGTLANRNLYDDQGEGFSYLATDQSPSTIYFKLSDTNADWDTGSPFGQGEQGIGIKLARVKNGTTDTIELVLDDDSVAGEFIFNKELLGLGNVNNTADMDKPISTSVANALANKADKDNVFTKNEVIEQIQNDKNKVIDGDFDFWYESINQTTSGYGSDTMYTNMHNGSTKTHSRQEFALGETLPNGERTPRYFSRTEVVSGDNANSYCLKRQFIEGVRTFENGKATISFFAKAESTKDIAVGLVQSFGTGGEASEIVIINGQKITLTAQWQLFELTFDIPSILGKTLGTDLRDSLIVSFWFDGGSTYDVYTDSLGSQSGTFDIAKVRMNAGEVAIREDYGEDGDSRYLRYFNHLMRGAGADRWAFYSNYNMNHYLPILLPVEMRTVPLILGLSSIAYGGTLSVGASKTTCRLTCSTGSTTSKNYGAYNINFKLDARI